MTSDQRLAGTLPVLAALSAALAIIAGAFGAHGAGNAMVAGWWKTGGEYQLIHGVAALVLLGRGLKGPAVTLILGAAIFSGTLYLMASGFPRWLGAVTPVGGLLMIGGWLWAAYAFWRDCARSSSRKRATEDSSTVLSR